MSLILSKSQYANKTQQLRVVPVSKAVNTELNIMDYEQVETIIRSQSRILVATLYLQERAQYDGQRMW